MAKLKGQTLFKKLALLTILTFLATHSSAKSWQNAIDDVYALAERYKETAEAESGETITYFLGTLHGTTDVKMHQCAILGRRMGFVEHIDHLEPPQPSLDSDPQILANNYASLMNWTNAAEWFAGVSQHERAKRWNLECVGKKGIPLGLWVDVPSEAFYRADGTYLWIYGDVVQGFSDRLRNALSRHPEVKTVAIGSGGGSVMEAIEAGYLVRQMGLSTQLSGECVSACPIFFLGGVRRSVMRPYPRLGFHKVSIDGTPVPESDSVYGVIGNYVRQMGANPEFFLAAMQNWEPDEMGYLTPDQACLAGVVTWYQGIITDKCW